MFRVRYVTITGKEVVKLLKFADVEKYLFELLCCVQDGGVGYFTVRKKRGCKNG